MLMRPWACVLNSFAHASGIPAQTLQLMVGHDGSEIIDPDIPEPYCRRGFSIHELVYNLYLLDIFVIELPKENYGVTNFWSRCFGNLYENIIADNFVVTNHNHACGVREGRFYDPSGKRCSLSEFDWDIIYIVETKKTK